MKLVQAMNQQDSLSLEDIDIGDVIENDRDFHELNVATEKLISYYNVLSDMERNLKEGIFVSTESMSLCQDISVSGTTLPHDYFFKNIHVFRRNYG
jgi:hypothetical protein